MGNLSWAYGNI
jgi:hypothetical protein